MVVLKHRDYRLDGRNVVLWGGIWLLFDSGDQSWHDVGGAAVHRALPNGMC